MDKSPLRTLTLEEFLESERHKLTGTLTPVTPESFAKWKKERLDKKAAEEAARKAKEATGRAMFESGNWRMEADLDSEDEGDDDAWNLEKLRKETEALQKKKEEERLSQLHGVPITLGEARMFQNLPSRRLVHESISAKKGKIPAPPLEKVCACPRVRHFLAAGIWRQVDEEAVRVARGSSLTEVIRHLYHDIYTKLRGEKPSLFAPPQRSSDKNVVRFWFGSSGHELV